MSWIVAPKNVQLSGKAMLTQKLAAVLGRLSGCRKMHDMWRSDALICIHPRPRPWILVWTTGLNN